MGHMANTLHELRDLMAQGANSVEADVVFASNGTVLKLHHEDGCDCGRNCNQKTEIKMYLSFLKNAVNKGGQYEGRLLLFYADTKTKGVRNLYQAGVRLAETLMYYLWDGVPYRYMLNVIVGIFGAQNKDLLKGVIQRLSKARRSSWYLDHLGFDVGGYNTLKVIARTYEELDIRQHRWQTDGIKNCHVRLYPTARMERIIRRRRGPKSFRNYVDKACFWTADDLHTIRKFLTLDIDSIITNKPANVLRVLREKEFIKTFRLANTYDSPWLRIP